MSRSPRRPCHPSRSRANWRWCNSDSIAGGVFWRRTVPERIYEGPRLGAAAILSNLCGFRKFWRINSGNSDHLAVRYSGRLSRCLRRGGVVKSQVLGPHRRTIQREETTALQDAVDDRVGEVFVMQYASPLVERFVGGEDHRALLPMPIVDHVKEHVGGVGAAREIANLIDDQHGWMRVRRERRRKASGAKRR